MCYVFRYSKLNPVRKRWIRAIRRVIRRIKKKEMIAYLNLLYPDGFKPCSYIRITDYLIAQFCLLFIIYLFCSENAGHLEAEATSSVANAFKRNMITEFLNDGWRVHATRRSEGRKQNMNRTMHLIVHNIYNSKNVCH